MGREKEYRQRLKYQVNSVKKKTLASQITGQLMDELGMGPAEGRLLARRMSWWLLRNNSLRGSNRIVFEANLGREGFRRKSKGQAVKIKLTPYTAWDLDVELEHGLKTMQAGRICRLIEEAYEQDALLSIKQLVLLTNITPTSLRTRLSALRKQGIYLPVLGFSKKDRRQPALLRSTWVLSRYLAGDFSLQIRKQAAISKGYFQDLLISFSRMAFASSSPPTLNPREQKEWETLINTTEGTKLKGLLICPQQSPRCDGEDEIAYELRTAYGMAPMKARAVMQLLQELKASLSDERPENTVIYWAVAASEPAGKPLEACALVPVRLQLIAAEDVPAPEDDRDFNCVSRMKYQKALRYASEAKYGGGYLTYADLGYLLGIHPTAISRLLRKHSTIVVPLRGNACDIGRGTSHRQQIIKLYLQMYTETQIASRTGHSYESIENYLKEFATVMILQEQGLAVPLIRKVTGRSLKLINLYLDLLKEYRAPEYAFRLNYLRGLVKSGELQVKKKSSELYER